MNKVTVSLNPDFETAIRKTARAYIGAIDECSKREWLFGGMANDEWLENSRKYQESKVNNEYFNILISKVINEVAGFALITDSGDTLKMWREVTAQFENVPVDLKKLPFDYFRKARTLWNKSEHSETLVHITAPIIPIAEAYAKGWTAAEMYQQYTDPVEMVKGISKREKWTPEKWGAFRIVFDEFMKGWL